MSKFGLIIQARYKSSRFQGKVIELVDQKPLFVYQINRLEKIFDRSSIILATSTSYTDNIISDIAIKNSIQIYRGNEDNVLERFYKCAIKYSLNIIIRICADSPLIDPLLIKKNLNLFKESDLDYLSNTINQTYPLGLNFEIFKFSALEKAFKNSEIKEYLEHVTPYIYNSKNFKVGSLHLDDDYSNIRLCVDEYDDLIQIKRVVNLFKQQNIEITIDSILNLYKKNPVFFIYNQHVKQNNHPYKNEKN